MKTYQHRTNGIIRHTLLAAACSLLLLTGCGSLDDENAACQATYQVRFRYDMNMKFADAFEHEVRAVTLYVIDADGNIVSEVTADGDQLDANDATITLQGIQPGQYSFLAWCTTNEHHSYTFGEGSKMTDLTCTMQPKRRGEADEIDHDLDALYHGLVRDVILPDSDGVHTYTVPLTKDTNRFRIVLQHISNSPLEPDQFEFALTDDNMNLDYDNSVIEDDEVVAYKPWNQSSALINSSEIASADELDGIEANSVIAELSASRLMTYHAPRLTVRNTLSDSTVINIPVIDYIQLVKGYENADMDLQEYLDRQDEYNMVFFIDERGSWLHTYIYINSWKVVLQTQNL